MYLFDYFYWLVFLYNQIFTNVRLICPPSNTEPVKSSIILETRFNRKEKKTGEEGWQMRGLCGLSQGISKSVEWQKSKRRTIEHLMGLFENRSEYNRDNAEDEKVKCLVTS